MSWGGVALPNNSSSITYKIGITNFGNTEIGIYSISGLPSNLTYEISDYKLHDKICDSTGRCSLGITKLITLTVKYKDGGFDSSSTEYNLKLDFDFRKMHTVTYEGITNNNYPTTVIDGGNLTFTATSNIPPKIVAFSNGNRVSYDLYSYENNKFTYNNVTNDITLKYQEKAYMAVLADGSYFKESTYKTLIDSIQFVDYVDTSGAVKTYDLSETSGAKDIIGWITSENDLYIGSEWNIYSKNLQTAFSDMSGVQTISFGNFNTSETTSMYYMFSGCSGLTSLDVSSFDTSNVTNMDSMFANLKKILSLNLSNFNTSKVKTMQQMFQNMESVTSLDVSNFNTINVSGYGMYGMFNSMKSLQSLNLNNFNTSKITTMDYMFNFCAKLENLEIDGFNTSNVTSMAGMFGGNHSLKELDVSSFDTSNVTRMHAMFEGCSALTTLDLSNFNTSKVTTMQQMFYSSGVKVLYLNNFSFDNVTNYTDMFYNVSSNVNVYVGTTTAQTFIQNALGEGVGTVTIAS